MIGVCLFAAAILWAQPQPQTRPQTQSQPDNPPVPPPSFDDTYPLPMSFVARLSDGRPTDAQATFNVRLAFTPEARDRAFSNDGVRALGDHDATLIAWPEPRQLALDIRRFTTAIAIIPVNLEAGQGGQAQIAGVPIELRPLRMNEGSDPLDEEFVAPDWEGSWNLRNWEYVSRGKWTGFLMFRAAALDQLRLSRMDGASAAYDTTVTATLPGLALTAQCIPDPTTERLSLKRADGSVVELPPLRVLDTDWQRWQGLTNAAKLKPSPPAGQPMHIGDLRANLLMFHRRRSRPLFTAGLKPPFDLAVLDHDNKVWEVIPVSTAAELPDPQKFTLVEYRYLLLLPHGFAAANGGLAGAQLTLPPRLAVMRAEPERYPAKIGDKEIRVEVVEERNWRNRGLMWRRFVLPDSGMLFLYQDSRNRSFWMLDCFMDMDITYVAPDWTMTDPIITMLHPAFPGGSDAPGGRQRPRTVDDLVAEAQARHGSGAPAQYVLEMEAGWFERHNIKPGARIEPGPAILEFLRRAEQ